MNGGTELDLEFDRLDLAAPHGGFGEIGSARGGAGSSAGPGGAAYLSDEEILGIEPADSTPAVRDGVISSARTADSRLGDARNVSNVSTVEDVGADAARRDSSGKGGPQNDRHGTVAERGVSPQMPAWMAALASDPKVGAEASDLWREHSEFRAAFSSAAEARAVADEARAIKELLPAGVRDVVSLREATQSVERIDAALFSGDTRAQSEVVTELARANPAAFRTLFAEAARVLAGMGESSGAGSGGRVSGSFGTTFGAIDGQASGPTLRENREGWGTQAEDQTSALAAQPSQVTHHASPETKASQVLASGHPSPLTPQQSPVTAQQSPSGRSLAPSFDAAAYAAFERGTNDAVARDVRGVIGETLARVMPEGVAEGASRRMGEDIFNEVHRALAADRGLSEQVAGVLSDRRFDLAQQQRVASLLAGRAKQLVPSVARRVIGEWTGTVLNTARAKASRQAAAASRVDIAAPGGSADSMPLRAMSAREVNYASMSDEEILAM